MTTRIGKKIIWKSIQCRGVAVSGTTTTVADSAMLIVYDKRPTGVLPSITDILITANSASFNNDANSGRFRILKRVNQIFMGNQLTPDTGKEAVTLDFFLRLNGLGCEYMAAGTGAIEDISEGAIYVVTVGSQAAGNTAPKFEMGFRTRFIDV